VVSAAARKKQEEEEAETSFPPARSLGEMDASIPWNEFPIGECADSVYVDWDVMHYPHLLLTGEGNSGKSVLQRNLFYHCLSHSDRWKFVGIDLYRYDFDTLSALGKHVVQGVATDSNEALKVISELSAELTRRYALLREARANSVRVLAEPLTSILVVINNADRLLLGRNAYVEESFEGRLTIREGLERLLDLGAAAGIHVVLSAHKLPLDLVSEDLMHNLDARIALGKIDREYSDAFFGQTTEVNETDLKGRGVIKLGSSVTLFQGHFIPSDDVVSFLDPKGAPNELLVSGKQNEGGFFNRGDVTPMDFSLLEDELEGADDDEKDAKKK
jgi:DNA segregation ATPase FtsK/SpoIIIE-like protein